MRRGFYTPPPPGNDFETATVPELRQQLLDAAPSGWWWWCIASVFRTLISSAHFFGAAGVCEKTSLQCEPPLRNPAADSALHHLLRRADSSSSQGWFSPEECFFRRHGQVIAIIVVIDIICVIAIIAIIAITVTIAILARIAITSSSSSSSSSQPEEMCKDSQIADRGLNILDLGSMTVSAHI